MLKLLIFTSILSLSCSSSEANNETLHNCDRVCSSNNSPKTCYYHFSISYAITGSLGCTNCIQTDGRRTISNVFNNQLPGPSINVCYGDTVIVDVTNGLLEATDIHWHGIHQVETPWMDGTQYLTQYPIEPTETFQYKFVADMPGTFFYHSHFEVQRALGAFGSFVIRSPSNPAEDLYDVDTNVMFVNDWFYDGDIYKTHNILINGLGQRQMNHITSSEDSEDSKFAEFSVQKGKRYRFRTIYSSNTNCTLEISVDNHNLTVISSDSFHFNPVTVESFGITSGERFDFIIDANEEVGTYWIRARGYYACAGMIQGAVLRYEDSSNAPKLSSLNSFYELSEVQLNPTVHDRNINDISVDKLQSFESWEPSSIYPTYYMNLTLRDKGMGNFDFFINEILYEPETRFSLLQEKYTIPFSKYYCNSSRFESEGVDCTQKTCKCPHMISIPCRRYVEILIFNPSHDVQPMHFHGYDLRVVGLGTLPSSFENTDQIQKFDKENPLPRNYDYPPQKDNVQIIPFGGYIILQMFTDNPGFWAVHCEVGTHSELGMFSIFKVCDPEDMKNVPVI